MATNKSRFLHVLITGASSGIGEALALYYADCGAVLTLSGRDEKRLSVVADECEKRGAKVETVILDVTNEDAMRRWIEEAHARSPLDLVIANAGISGGTGGAEGLEDIEQVKQIFSVNVDGVFHTIFPALNVMKKSGKGQIAIVSSIAGFRGWPGAPAYCASKAAVKTYGESLRGMAAGHGVGVNVICPGFVVSRMTDANDFKMPFLMDTTRAAHIIAKGLEKNRSRIAFPWPMYLIAGFLGMLPDVVAQRVLKRTPEKKAL